MNSNREFFSVQEFCHEFSISPSTVYDMIHKGKIRAAKIGRCWKIPKADFLRLLYEQL